ncbi:MAG: anthranilate synthase component I [Candidatus Omnitrophica bacterium]|nr:anthranilate synthase component I [Candidatus Omnitrophota bacterium]
MYNPSLKEFLKLAQKGNVIPVYKEINADLDTPVSAFLKVEKGDYSFLLESVEGQEKIARYSFLGSDPALVFKSKGRNIEINYPAQKKTRRFTAQGSPLDEIKKIMRDYRAVAVKGLPRFYGGLVGYIGYDMVRFFEELPEKNPDDLRLADAILFLTDKILIFDHVNHTIKIVFNIILPVGKLSSKEKEDIYSRALRNIEAMHKDMIKDHPHLEKTTGGCRKISVTSNFSKAQFQDVVCKIKAYITKGDVIQAVPSQRFKMKMNKPAFEVYRKLRSLNPSPYMYFLKLKDTVLIGSSPEMLVRCEDGIIQTRPIAGSRPRGRNQQEDAGLAMELLNDKKEKAEHIMLVDLGRNDLGRVSKPGKVRVSEFMNVEKYSHIMHIVSEVRAELDRKKYDIYDVLRAAFPAGTVTGSPKVRAMEIIEELENIRRGPYAGCVGYFSFSHNMDTCITIRTIVAHKGYAYIQAGAGIVADSVPAREYVETVNKAMALIEALS